MSLGDNLKTTILKSIEAFGKSASSLAEGAQQKLKEMNLEVRRRELADKIPGMVMELYSEGAELPESLIAVLDEMSVIDAELKEMRAASAPAADAQPEEAPAEDEPGQEADEEVCVEECCEAPAEEIPAEETIGEVPAAEAQDSCPCEKEPPVEPATEDESKAPGEG